MGDGAARRERFEAVYRELYPAICGYALRRLREPEDAAEPPGTTTTEGEGFSPSPSGIRPLR